MKQTEGDRNFTAPPLKKAAVFVGITGIMAGDEIEPEIHSRKAKKAKDKEIDDEDRDLYRKIMAAEDSRLPWQPRADDMIEDLFNGGDGWCRKRPDDIPGESPTPPIGSSMHDHMGGGQSDEDTRTLRLSKQRNWSGFLGRRHGRKSSKGELQAHDNHDDAPLGQGLMHMADAPRGVQGRGSFEHQAAKMQGEVEGRKRPPHAVDELEIREDLRCWTISGYD